MRHIRGERTESREAGGQQNKQATAPGPRAPGARNQRKRGTAGAHKKNREPRGSDENCETRKGGGGGSNHQGAADVARGHGKPGSGRQAKQTAHSAKARDTRGRTPGKARDKGGAQKTKPEAGGGGGTKNKAPRPKAPGAGNQRKQETKGARKKKGWRDGERGNKGRATKRPRKGQPDPGGG